MGNWNGFFVDFKNIRIWLLEKASKYLPSCLRLVYNNSKAYCCSVALVNERWLPKIFPWSMRHECTSYLVHAHLTIVNDKNGPTSQLNHLILLVADTNLCWFATVETRKIFPTLRIWRMRIIDRHETYNNFILTKNCSKNQSIRILGTLRYIFLLPTWRIMTPEWEYIFSVRICT